MDLIIGGAFQGKLEYAKKHFNIKASDVCECWPEKEPDLTKRCLYGYERYVLRCMRAGTEPPTSFDGDKIIIMNDIFCGVVPVEPEARAWREKAGRVMAAIAANSNTVTRLFCGIPKRLK